MFASMSSFSNFINAQELVDLPLVGRRFNWTNHQERAAMSKIDRFLLSKDWEVYFPGVIQHALPRMVSDHFPLKLSSTTVDWGPKPFRFENCWLIHKESLPIMRNYWL